MNHNKQQPLEYWVDTIAACRASGLSDNHWCKLNSVAPSTFYKYSKKLREQACSLSTTETVYSPVIQEVVPLNAAPCLVGEIALELEQNALSSQVPAITLHLGRAQVEINNHATETLLSNVIAALKNIC